jgi:hypothetical protein
MVSLTCQQPSRACWGVAIGAESEGESALRLRGEVRLRAEAPEPDRS